MNPFILALQARNLTVEIHLHCAYQIVLSNDTSFNQTISGKPRDRIRDFLIKPHITFFCVSEKTNMECS